MVLLNRSEVRKEIKSGLLIERFSGYLPICKFHSRPQRDKIILNIILYRVPLAFPVRWLHDLEYEVHRQGKYVLDNYNQRRGPVCRVCVELSNPTIWWQLWPSKLAICLAVASFVHIEIVRIERWHIINLQKPLNHQFIRVSPTEIECMTLTTTPYHSMLRKWIFTTSSETFTPQIKILMYIVHESKQMENC